MYDTPRFENIPPWADGAPRYSFRSENGHQGGHHVHLYERGQLTNVCFTRQGNEAVAYTHCEGSSTVTIDSLSRNAIRRLERDGLVRVLSREREWTQNIDESKVIDRFALYGE